MRSKIRFVVTFIILLLFFLNCIKSDHQIKAFKIGGKVLFQNDEIRLEYDNRMYCKVYYRLGKEELSINNALQEKENSMPSHYIRVNGQDLKDFDVDYENLVFSDIKEEFGFGKKIVFNGTAECAEGIMIKKVLTVRLFNDYPSIAVTSAVYKNLDSYKEIVIERVYNNIFMLNSTLACDKSNPYDFFFYDGNSNVSENDSIIKVSENFSRESRKGINVFGFDKRLPLSILWNKTMGMTVGYINSEFKHINLPVVVQPDYNVKIGIITELKNEIVPPGGEYRTIKTIALVHSGSFKSSIKVYHDLIKNKR